MGIIAAGQITVVDLSDAPVLNAFITASRPTTQTYSKDSKNYNPSYASTPQVLTLNVTKSGSTTSIIDSISGLHWFVVDGPVKTEITSKVNTSNEYISGNYNEILTTKLNIDTNKGYRHYEATGTWRDPSTDLDVQFSANINLLLTQNGATGPQGPQGDTGATGNGIANTVVTYGLSMTDTTEPATWSSERPALIKGMYLWTRTVIIYTNGESTTSYQISYIPKDADATAEIDKTKQELLEKLETVRDDSLTAVEEAKEQLVTVRDESLAAAEEAKQQVSTVADDLSKAKTDFQNAVNAVDTKATNVQNDLSQAKQDLASQAQKLQEQANAQSELTNRVSSVEETTNGTKTTVSELSKTVDQNSKNITSVTARTKVVEDDLAGTKTTLSQVKTTADSTSQKTATLESGLNGLSAKFETLKVGSRNYFKNSKSRKYYIDNTETQDVRTSIDDDFWKNDTRFTKDYVRMSFDIAFNPALPTDFATNVHFGASPWYNCGGITFKGGTTALQHFDLKFNLSGAGDSYKTDNVFIRLHNTLPLNTAVSLENFNLYLSAVVEDYSQNGADVEQKIAEYKQNADQNYASLQTTVQNLDGTVQHNKTVADQTAQGFTTRIESLETYKDGETTRANQYFELAKTETARQLSVERTAISKGYVAKSTYTSDVTGIRNELSATTITANTTKQNLASYQASNDRVVANLQSNIQTANGDISSLKTKVEAVPGQITSAVSSVESKIPTEIGSSNLLRKTTVNANNLRLFETSNSTISVVTKDGHQTYKIVVSATNNSGVNFKSNAQYYNLIKDRNYTFSFWVLTNKDKPYSFNSLGHIQAVNENGDLVGSDALHQHTSPVYSTSVIKANTWTKVWCTFKATSNSYFIPFFWYLNSGDEIYIYDMMLNEGKVSLSYTSAPEDTADQITTLSSQIKQTSDGITLLATKTELNSAKNELQSGINTATNKANNAQTTANNNAQTIRTHTTQISALNTGLSAKVSQSDFNTLSGRVTTAENNITAKANELSSKITAVEGKIPTEIGSSNLLRKTTVNADNLRLFGKSNSTLSVVTKDGHQTYKIVVTANGYGVFFNGNEQYYNLIKDRTYTFSFWVLTNKDKPYSSNSLGHIQAVNTNGGIVGNDPSHQHTQPVYSTNIIKANTWTKVWCTFKATSNSYFKPYFWYLNSGDEIYIYDMMLNEGNIPLSYTSAPEDAIEEINTLSSELKQTQDGITLLATKTELSTAKNELQSGINTATNKANAAQSTANNAQSTANNNAQTISTHTTQISALNTGLSAKVSQSDFNTLSGRVTTAENNIIAKANELSSKITTVEGKIPTEIGSSNLLRKTTVNADNLRLFGKSNSTLSVVTKDGHQTYKIVVTANGYGVNFKGNAQYYNLIKNRTYTFSFWVLTNKDKPYSFNSLGHIQAVNENGDLVGSDRLHQHSNPIYSTNTIKANTWTKVWCTFKATSNSYFRPFFWYLNSGDEIYIYDMMLNEGKIPLSYTSAPEDYDSKLASAQSEFKQTTDSIKASVTSLDKSTVKSSSLTINADGIVMKAGKSTTDVANAIGSYFAVNQNAINLFSDKINVKGHMIVDGAINVNKISGLDANFIKSKIEYAMIDWLKGKSITAYNGNMTIDLQNGRISFKDGSNAVYRQTPDGIHTGFLHFDAGSLGGIYAAFGATSTREGVNSRSSAFAGIRCYRVSKNGASHEAKIDKIEVVGDTVQFGHGYTSDGSIAMGGGFIMDNAAFANEAPYSFNRVVKSIESLWRILYDHARNTGYRFNDSAFINAVSNEYRAWHELHNM